MEERVIRVARMEKLAVQVRSASTESPIAFAVVLFDPGSPQPTEGDALEENPYRGQVRVTNRMGETEIWYFPDIAGSINVRADGYAEVVSEVPPSVDLENPLLLYVSESTELVASVLDPDGRPLPSARVEGASVQHPSRRVSATTDEEGNAILQGLPPGEARVNVRTEGYGSHTSVIELLPETKSSIQIQLDDIDRLRFAVQVWIEGSGEPARGVTVGAFNRDTRLVTYRTTDGQGWVDFGELPLGTYALQTFGSGYVPVAGKEVRLEVDRPNWRLLIGRPSS